MRTFIVMTVALLAITAARGAAAAPAAEAVKPQTRASREFFFTYSGAVTGLAPGKVARVWVPVPPGNPEQRAELVRKDLPAEGRVAREPGHGNSVLYFQSPADARGNVKFELVYRVKRREVRGESDDDAGAAVLAQYLQPDRLVPVGGRPATLLDGKPLPADQAAAGRLLYDLVLERMEYRKDKPGWGNGDAAWACESGFGNCSDFHSLFISLARLAKVPAKFEIGFALPEGPGVAGGPGGPPAAGEVAGYHCWAKFHPAGHRWVPVDISEAKKHPEKTDYFFGSLCANRVTFSTGRDIELVPKQAGPPLNFFIYPYVEVDGRVYPADKVHRRFHYHDIAAGPRPN